MQARPSPTPSAPEPPPPAGRSRLAGATHPWRRAPLGWAVASALVAASLCPSPAGAQNAPPPNLLLLVDSSGSMEYTSTPAPTCTTPPCLPECYPKQTDPTKHGKSRWTNLVEVLTGSIQTYACFAHDRNLPSFSSEFSLAGTAPADYHYPWPYDRPLSSNCAVSPGPLGTNPYAYTPGDVVYRPYSAAVGGVVTTDSTTCSGFAQQTDGLLDAYQDNIRFGLMTFDTHQGAGTGVSSTGSADYTTGIDGTWSYFLGTAHSGEPPNCKSPLTFEVGGRNAAAPTWEGKMVGFGKPSPGTADLQARAQRIQQILLATRPYGATPIDGLLDDARNYYWYDTSNDPEDPSYPFGPAGLSTTASSLCETDNILLLSDGEPTDALRPKCEETGSVSNGVCPYQTPEQIANDLANPPSNKPAVKTYVIGFGVGQVTDPISGAIVKCADLTATQCTDWSSNPDVRACCRLNSIAFNGTPTAERGVPGTLDHALFAQDPTTLSTAISTVLTRVLGNIPARTAPVFASATAASSGLAASMEFRTGITVRSLGIWSGKLERVRSLCDSTGKPVEQAVDAAKGDDFIANVNTSPTSRVYFSHEILSPSGAVVAADQSARPNVAATVADGVGTNTVRPWRGVTGDTLSTSINPASMGITDTTCDNSSRDLTATQCSTTELRWLVGLANSSDPSTRCASPGATTCDVVADIYHSTPEIVGRPSGFLRDSTYLSFATAYATRVLTLYTSTNDGFLHAFNAEPTTQTNNELWGYLPPAALANVKTVYPGKHSPILDGMPVVKDVAATPSSTISTYTPLQRSSLAGSGSGASTWRTVLLQAFGPVEGGYFAVDVTQPTFDGAKATTTGPQLLWQLTTGSGGAPLFGTKSVTPLITTVLLNTTVSGVTVPMEVAVAVLPGGASSVATSITTGCLPGVYVGVDPSLNFMPRKTVPCYTRDAARSLTIVRLDTGEVLRSFRPPLAGTVTTLLLEDTVASWPVSSSVVTPTYIPAPIVGRPVAYPSTTGAVADRVYVGDQEGRLYRVDLSNPDPTKWAMLGFFDAYYSALSMPSGQPIVGPPILSVDTAGQITVDFATGDQEVLSPGTVTNFALSLTETFTPATSTTLAKIAPKVNWIRPLTGGERVLGSMALFDRNLFFTTFLPNSTSSGSCAVGTARVCGVDFIRPAVSSTTTTSGPPGPFPTLVIPSGATSTVPGCIDYANSAPVFGVGIRQKPSCKLSDLAAFDNAYLGYGTASAGGTYSPAQFELVFQQAGASTAPGGTVGVQSISIPSPRGIVHIDSWAAILE